MCTEFETFTVSLKINKFDKCFEMGNVIVVHEMALFFCQKSFCHATAYNYSYEANYHVYSVCISP